MKDFLVVVKVGAVENKEIWRLLKEEGFTYIGNRTMVRSKKGSVTAIEKYKAYLNDLLMDYDKVSIKLIEI